MKQTEYGIQMCSIRDVSERSLRDALQTVAEMGFRYIEFAGFYDHPAKEVRKWLDEFHLLCSGTHTFLPALSADTIAETIAYHQEIGCNNIIVPGCDDSDRKQTEDTIRALREAKQVLSENGIRLGYHNHSWEFFPNRDSVVFENEIIEKTDLDLQIDTFWLFNAGIDVIPYLEAHKDRIRIIHLKDGIPSAQEHRSFDNVQIGVTGCSLGEGKAPIAQIHRWCEQNQVLMVVESEGLDPTGPKEVQRCMNYLRTL